MSWTDLARNGRILVVDDAMENVQILHQALRDEHEVLFALSGEKAIEVALAQQPDLILLDAVMPGMDGYAVCAALEASPRLQDIPVIFVTALGDATDEVVGFEAGAVDYITKPVSPPIVRARVRTHLSLVRADELKRTRLEIVQRLGLAAEYKDNETGLHVIRMSHYARILGLALGMSEEEADDLLHAAPMHDVGKIGIPDSILQKPGPLDAEEWKVMQSHASIGGDIIGRHESGMLAMAHLLAVTHHEKWDGSGYPAGLKGEEIALVGRIVAIADVFDALTSARPYKQAWPVEQAVEYLQQQRGKHFEPRLGDLFIEQMPALLEIKQRWAEHS